MTVNRWSNFTEDVIISLIYFMQMVPSACHGYENNTFFFFAIHYKNRHTIHAALLRSKNSKCQHTNLIDITFLHCENTKDIQPMDKYTIISQLVLMPYIGEFTL